MLSKVKNNGTINGKLYGMGRRALKRGEDGRISGAIVVQVNDNTEDAPSTVEINFLPQSPVYKSGKPNASYETLSTILSTMNTVEEKGYDGADMLRLTGVSISNNAYYSEDNSEWKLNEYMQLRGSFIHIDQNVRPSCGIEIQMLVTDTDDEKNREGETTGNLILKGQVFDDYRGMFFPVSFIVKDPSAVNYIVTSYTPNESYVTLQVEVGSSTVVSENSNAALGFGEKAVESSYTKTEYVIIGGSESGFMDMSDEDMAKAKSVRETFLSEQKNRAIDYANSKGSAPKASSAPKADVPVASGGAAKYQF